MEKAVETSIEATRYAKSQGLYVVFFPIDASRAEMGWYLDTMERVATEGHMDAMALVDTFGVLSPHAVSYFVRETQKRIKKPLETHFHMDFGMGVANTIIALAEGASVVHSTISGIGERAGNAPTEDTLISLLTMYGVDTGIKTEQLTKLSRYVRKIAKVAMPANRQIVGDDVFDVESGIIASWLKNVGPEHILEVFPIHWSLVGQRAPRVVLGKNSGIDSIKIHLQRLRMQGHRGAGGRAGPAGEDRLAEEEGAGGRDGVRQDDQGGREVVSRTRTHGGATIRGACGSRLGSRLYALGSPQAPHTAGRRPPHGAAASKAAAARSTVASASRLPTICSPTGNPAGVKPQGTVAAGCPVRLNG